jgi:hypothetical protein
MFYQQKSGCINKVLCEDVSQILKPFLFAHSNVYNQVLQVNRNRALVLIKEILCTIIENFFPLKMITKFYVISDLNYC